MNKWIAGLYLTSALASVMATPALAQNAEAQSLDEVVVTARRIDERLQDVPISITVYSPEQLAQRNIVTATDLATYTPALTTNQRFGPEKSSFVIRGFTQESGTSPSVGVYFADVVVPRAQGGTTTGNTALPGAFLDLQNVQVLKGPQGTLFGRNTTGGAVLLTPQKPTREFEGHVEGSLGNYDMWRTQAVVNLPLADTLRLRVAVDRMQREGYLKNHSGIGPDDYNDVNYFAGRVSLVADLTDNLENYTIFSANHSFGHGYASRIAQCRPTGGAGAAALLGPLACAQMARQDARGDNLLDVEVNNPKPLVDIRQVQAINTTTWHYSDNLTIKNIVSYAQFQERDSFSLNSENFRVPSGVFAGQPFNYILLNPGPIGANAQQSTFTEELQFQGRAFDDRLDWQAGAYLEVSKPNGWSQGYTGILLSCTDMRQLECINPIGGGTVSAARATTTFNNKGLYTQATYKLTDQFSLTGGIRYTIDKTTGVSENTRIRFRPGAGGVQDMVCNDTLRFQGPGGTPLVVPTPDACHYSLSTKSKKPTWLLGLDYKPSTDMLLYAKWARGYRQGGVNMSNIGLETWGPEKVDTYEAGLKTSFNTPVPTRFNIAGYYNDFRDQQITGALIAKPGAGIAGGTGIINAGKSRLWGIDADASIRLFDGFTLDLGYAYLNTKLQEIEVPVLPADSPFSQIIPTAEVGAPLSFAPKNRVTVTGTYLLPLSADLGDISLGATYVHTDAQNATSPSASPLYRLPATDLLNLNFDWKNVMQKPIDLSIFATNVTNEIYPVAVGSSYTSAGFESVLVGPPRMYGVRLRYRFGG
ncbi:TonB-dependent receptor [Phenylobacterium sp. LjRoot219]|uniref:TonB-dependent receptor n=1 Tax=Phenylobacterium sp. LjRoot219 TaxID=3342283 RepID=UPI003ECF032E